MSAKNEHLIVLSSAEFDLDTVGDKATFTIPQKCELLRSQLIITSADAGGGTVTFDKRVTAGSDSGRLDADAGTITVPASNQQGKCLYEVPSSHKLYEPGDQIVVEVTADPGAGATMVAQVILLYIPETEENQLDMVAA